MSSGHFRWEEIERKKQAERARSFEIKAVGEGEQKAHQHGDQTNWGWNHKTREKEENIKTRFLKKKYKKKKKFIFPLVVDILPELLYFSQPEVIIP